MSSVNLKRKKADAQIAEMAMDDFDRFEYFFATHWKKLVWGAVAVVVAAAVACTVWGVIHHQRAKAVTALGSANTRAELEAALAAYGSSPAATVARLRLAAACIDAKDYNAALATLQSVSADAPEEFKYRAKLNEGYVLELAGKAADAKAFFLGFIQSAAPVNFRVEASCAAARLQLAFGETDAARSTIANGRQLIAAARQQNLAAQQMLGWERQLLFLQSHLPAAK